MSRRKQANPRSLKPETDTEDIKTSESTQLLEPKIESPVYNEVLDGCYEASPSECGDEIQYSITNAQNNIHIEVNVNNIIESDDLGTDQEASCFSASLDSPTSSGASSCPTPTSASDLPASQLSYTTVISESPYACSFCKKTFPRFSFLKKHEQMHHDQMPFRCEFCSRLFKHKRSRDRHIMLHTGDKKYRCICCEAAFSRSDHLKIHMKTHGSRKLLSHKLSGGATCKINGLFSHQKRPKTQWLKDETNLTCNKLNSSEETTSSLENYPCKHCGVCFEKLSQLQDHISSEHPSTGRGKFLSNLLDISDGTCSDSPQISTKLACIYCASDIFTSMEQLRLHVQVVHNSILNGEYSEMNYSEQVTNRLRKIPSLRDLTVKSPENHNNVVHVSHSCEVCNLKFVSIQKLQYHILSVHKTYDMNYLNGGVPRDTYTCVKCVISFETWNLFSEHCLTVHDGSPNDLLVSSNSDFPNYLTSKRFKNGLEQKKSSNRQYDHGTLLCNQCDAALPNFESFRNHVKSHLEPSSYTDGNMSSLFEMENEKISNCTYSCPHCVISFNDADECEQHVANHFMATSLEYECKCCMTTFTTSEELQMHVLEAHVQHLYRCSLCKKTFDSKLPLQVHFAVEHSSECKLYRCTACSYNSVMFRSKLEFFLHVRNVHGGFTETNRPKSIECSFCRQQFSTNIEMQFHLTDHMKQFHCKFCPEIFHIEYLLDKHMEFCHSDLQVIDDSFTNKNADKNSNSSKSQRKLPKLSSRDPKYQEMFDSDNYSEYYENEYQNSLLQTQSTENIDSKNNLHCNYCGDLCTNRNEMEMHLKQHLQNGSCIGKYKCNICDEVCSSAVILAEHKLTHCKIISSNNCIHCKAMLTNKDQFYLHLIHHNANKSGNSEPVDNDNNNNKNISDENINSGRKSKTKVLLPTPCIICRQTLVSDIEVKIHSQFHLNNTITKKEYKCCVCKNFTDNKNVIIANSGTRYLCKSCYLSTEKPLMDYTIQCVKCKVTCSQNSAAGNSKSFICNQCKLLESNDNEFIIINKKENPSPSIKNFECYLCKGSFSTSIDLEIHLIEHTFVGYSSYTCYICSAVFTASQGLRNHILEHGLDARPYDCSKCGVKFFFRAQLENHNFIHEENYSNSNPEDIILPNQESSDNYKLL